MCGGQGGGSRGGQKNWSFKVISIGHMLLCTNSIPVQVVLMQLLLALTHIKHRAIYVLLLVLTVLITHYKMQNNAASRPNFNKISKLGGIRILPSTKIPKWRVLKIAKNCPKLPKIANFFRNCSNYSLEITTFRE